MSVGTKPEPVEEDREELRGQMSFFDHLEELRRRIIHSLIAIAVAFSVSWIYKEDLYRIVKRPISAVIGDKGLNFMTLTEPFNLELKLAFVAAVFLASPFIMAQIWLFISPGLYKHERRYALPFIISSSLLFLTGGVFGYFVAFPFAAQFLVNVGTQELGMTAVINGSDYFDKFITIELALGIVFEIPAVIFILSRIGLVSGPFLLKNTKYAFLLSAVVAAIITPTSDIPNMMIMMVPMMLLYLLGVLVAFVFGKKRRVEAD